jgi:ATP-dependent Clp protease adaptor protein ClpS
MLGHDNDVADTGARQVDPVDLGNWLLGQAEMNVAHGDTPLKGVKPDRSVLAPPTPAEAEQASRAPVPAVSGSGSMLAMADRHDQADGALKERVELKKQEPTLYNVILLNDDYTTMEFVLQVLETLFQKSPAEAYRIMMHVHRSGRGLAGVYTYEVAETKAATVASLASEAGYPLRATIEEA